MTIRFLVSVLEQASQEYHNNGTYLKLSNDIRDKLHEIAPLPTAMQSISVMTDQLFDFYEEYLRSVDPQNDFLKKVGATVLKQKAKLPYQMSGMEKITVGTVATFTNENDGPYLVSDKLDGISIQIEYGSEIKAFTRGDGVYGEDISYIVPYMRLPKSCPYTHVRGEIIMKKEVFEKKWATEYENPRNLVAGKVNANKIHPSVRDMDVVIYGVLNDSSETPSAQLKKLEAAGFNVVHHVVLDNTLRHQKGDLLLSNLLKERKAKSPYELDGLVVITDETGHRYSVDNPSWGRKFKENVDFHQVKVVGCNYEPSKDGYLKPTLVIEPTRMGGVTVTNVTAFNQKFIIDNEIGLDSVLLVTRSGDVIPHIVDVIARSAKTFEPSEQWNWNETGVDAVVQDPDSHPLVQLRRITFFFRTLEVEELGGSTFEKAVESGFDTVEKIIKMSREDWKSIDGFSGRRGDIAYDEMQKCLKSVYLPRLADASGMFGRGFGTTRFEAILEAHPDLMKMSFTKESGHRLARNVSGFGDTLAQQFGEGIIKFIPWVDSILNHIVFAAPEKTEVVGQAMVGQKVTFTGFRNDEWVKMVEEQGGEYVDFGSKTTILVYGGKKSSKVDKAIAKGVKTFSQGEFMEYMEKQGVKI